MGFLNSKQRKAFFAKLKSGSKVAKHDIEKMRKHHAEKQEKDFLKEKAKLEKEILIQQKKLELEGLKRKVSDTRKQQIHDLKKATRDIKVARFKSSKVGRVASYTGKQSSKVAKKAIDYEKAHGKQQITNLRKSVKGVFKSF